jgi:hypothetical protein
LRQVFKGDNYSREETIRGNTVIIFPLLVELQWRYSVNTVKPLHSKKKCSGKLSTVIHCISLQFYTVNSTAIAVVYLFIFLADLRIDRM